MIGSRPAVAEDRVANRCELRHTRAVPEHPRALRDQARAIVVLADDDDGVRESVTELLEDAGFLVLTARNGKEALARLRGLAGATVAIVDLVMPGMDGWELITTMKNEPALAQIPTIAISGHGRSPVKGADLLLEKPLSPTDLLAALEQFRALGRLTP